MTRGSRLPEWVDNMMIEEALNLREEFPSHRNPSAREVREALKARLEDEGEIMPGGLPHWFPSERTIRDRLAKLKTRVPRIPDLDNPWNLGMSSGHGLSDDASGALMKMWKFCITHPTTAPLSIRTARWVSKLRWVPEAGGSVAGEVLDPKEMYFAAILYSGRERQVQGIRGDEDMRSGVLDAKLMLGSEQSEYLQAAGVLSDDTGISHEQDASAYFFRGRDVLRVEEEDGDGPTRT